QKRDKKKKKKHYECRPMCIDGMACSRRMWQDCTYSDAKMLQVSISPRRNGKSLSPTPTCSLSLSPTPTCSLSLSLSLSLSPTPTCSLSLSPTPSCSLSLSLCVGLIKLYESWRTLVLRYHS